MKPPIKNTTESNKVLPLTKPEYKILLDSSNLIYKTIYSIGGFMGLRLTEILHIQVCDIDFYNKMLKYRVAKTDEITFKYIPDVVLELIIQIIEMFSLELNDFLFLVFKGKYKGNRLSEKTVSKRTKELFIKLSIGTTRKLREIKSEINPIQKAQLNDKTFHSLRHFYGTEFFDLCENKEFTARTLRHTRGNTKTVDKYVQINIQRRELEISKKIIEQISSL